MISPLLASEPPAARESWSPISIAVERCKGCSLCVANCPPHVLALDEGSVNALGHHPVRLVDAARCTSCALCARICPDAVFEVFAARRGSSR
jgi:2-oxoglutarate ferredoxin oxidoreductase subunit delta